MTYHFRIALSVRNRKQDRRVHLSSGFLPQGSREWRKQAPVHHKTTRESFQTQKTTWQRTTSTCCDAKDLLFFTQKHKNKEAVFQRGRGFHGQTNPAKRRYLDHCPGDVPLVKWWPPADESERCIHSALGDGVTLLVQSVCRVLLVRIKRIIEKKPIFTALCLRAKHKTIYNGGRFSAHWAFCKTRRHSDGMTLRHLLHSDCCCGSLQICFCFSGALVFLFFLLFFVGFILSNVVIGLRDC